MPVKPRPLSERFWDKVDTSGDCWEWTSSLNHDGYGLIATGGRKAKRVLLAHRAAWMLTHGDIPSDMRVLHSCDNRRCVRPDHLFIGTQADNIADMKTKGRAWNPTAERKKGQSHCVHGHEFTEANTHLCHRPDGYTVRRCRACDRLRHRAA